MSRFSIKFDISDLTGVAEHLSRFAADELPNATLRAVNEVAQRAYDDARPRITARVNFTDSYVQQRMDLRRATNPLAPTATVVALGKYVTTLGHFKPRQVDTKVNWTNARIKAEGHKFGKWPGWTKRTGDSTSYRRIAADRKGAGGTVEVLRGVRRGTMPGAFLMNLRRGGDAGDRVGVFVRSKDGKTVRHLYGPSVYQQFRTVAANIENEVGDDLELTITRALEDQLAKALS